MKIFTTANLHRLQEAGYLGQLTLSLTSNIKL